MSASIETILFVFILIVLGYGAVALGLLKAEAGDGLSDFVFTFAIPLLLFRTILAAEFGDAAPWGLWATYFTAVAVTWTSGHLIIRRVFGRDARAGVVAGVTAAFSNLVLVGIPLVSGVYGTDGLVILSLIVSVHLVIMMATSIALFEWAVRRDGVVTGRVGIWPLVSGFVVQLLRNPLVIGILCGLAARLSGIEMPALATRLVDSLANVAAPVALFAMGMSLRRFGLHGHLVPALSLSLLKLMLMPAVALAMAWLLDLPPLTAQVAVIAASLPAGVNSWLIASRFNTGQRLASTAMTVGTTLAVGTLIFWATVAAMVFG
jgi:malonate transporter and related proteins